MVFLGWAWVRSIHHYDAVSWGEAHGGRGILLSQRDSKVLMTWNTSKIIAVVAPGFSVSSVKLKPRSHTVLPQAINWQESPEYPLQTASIAHWFLIFLFLLPWSTFLVCRSRRMKRFAVAVGEPPP